jgi:hypothetical protein
MKTMAQDANIAGSEQQDHAHDDARMPVAVRRVVFAILAVVAGGAVYLFAVRGVAMVYDLGALGAKLFCL